MDDPRKTWWSIDNPETGTTKCSLPPLSLWIGGKDYLIDAKKLIERLKEQEMGVKLLRIEEIENSEVYMHSFLVERVKTTLSAL